MIESLNEKDDFEYVDPDDEEREKVENCYGNNYKDFYLSINDDYLVDESGKYTPEHIDKLSDMPLLVCEQQIRKILGNLKRNFYDLGRILWHAKEQIFMHGEFQAWVRDMFAEDFSYETANNCMKIYRYFSEVQTPECIELVPMTYLLKLIREFKDEALNEFEKVLYDGPVKEVKLRLQKKFAEMDKEKKQKIETIPQIEQMMEKYKDEKHVRYYRFLLKACLERTRYLSYINRTKFDYINMPKIMDDLRVDSPFPT